MKNKNNCFSFRISREKLKLIVLIFELFVRMITLLVFLVSRY